MNTIVIVLPILTLLMFDLGLALRPADFRLIACSPGGSSSNVFSMLAGGGVAVSWLMRLTGREQRTIVIEIGMQNAAQAITVASSPFVFNNDVMAIPAIIYALMMNIILLTYVGVVKVRQRAQ